MCQFFCLTEEGGRKSNGCLVVVWTVQREDWMETDQAVRGQFRSVE